VLPTSERGIAFFVKTAARIGSASLWSRKAARLNGPVVFVPTMGALHEGHAALIRRARRVAGKQGSVVVSVFVNPTQFNVPNDLKHYPRTFDQDHALCHKEGVDLFFHPSPEEMYAPDASVMVREKSLSSGLCGASRPGHFDGVCTVVAMFFQIIRPEIVIFGEKDWQQLAIIRRMARDLKMSVKILGHPTVREKDGLALSSRNRLLTPEARRVVPRIYESLQGVAMAVEEGESSVARLLRQLHRDLSAIPGATLDYAEIVDEKTLDPIRKLTRNLRARALTALYFGSVRLIDNVPLQIKSTASK